MDFLWVYILGVIAFVSVTVFILTFSKEVQLTEKLKLKKRSLTLNFSLLLLAGTCIGLVIYLFSLLKDQINLIG